MLQSCQLKNSKIKPENFQRKKLEKPDILAKHREKPENWQLSLMYFTVHALTLFSM
jgi:hypothetical protein